MTPSTPAPGLTPRTTAQAANLKIILDRIDDNDFSGIDFIGSLQVLAEEVRRLSTPQGAGAVAWLVTGGTMYRDRAFTDVAQADISARDRKDGATVVPLYAIPSPSSPNVGGLTQEALDAMEWFDTYGTKSIRSEVMGAVLAAELRRLSGRVVNGGEE